MDVTGIPPKEFDSDVHDNLGRPAARGGRAKLIAKGAEGDRLLFRPFALRDIVRHSHQPDDATGLVLDLRSGQEDREFGSIFSPVNDLAPPTARASLLQNFRHQGGRVLRRKQNFGPLSRKLRFGVAVSFLEGPVQKSKSVLEVGYTDHLGRALDGMSQRGDSGLGPLPLGNVLACAFVVEHHAGNIAHRSRVNAYPPSVAVLMVNLVFKAAHEPEIYHKDGN